MIKSKRLQALAQRGRDRVADPDGFLVLRKILKRASQVVTEICDMVKRRGVGVYSTILAR